MVIKLIFAAILTLQFFLFFPLKALCSKTPEGIFWHWFLKNEKRLFDEGTNEQFSELQRAIKQVDKNLTFELSDQISNGKRNLVISADGRTQSFDKVVALTKSAPNLARWNISSFRQPHYSHTLSFSSLTIHSKDVKFILRPYKGHVGVFLFIKGFRKTPDNAFEKIGELFLDNYLGEYVAAKNIRSLDLFPLNRNIPKEAQPLKTLPIEFRKFTLNR